MSPERSDLRPSIHPQLNLGTLSEVPDTELPFGSVPTRLAEIEETAREGFSEEDEDWED